MPTRARRQLLAAVRGSIARPQSADEIERRIEKQEREREDREWLRSRCTSDREYRARLKAWHDIGQRLKILKELVNLYFTGQREAELASIFSAAARRDVAPRLLCRALGMTASQVQWRLNIARSDIDRARKGLPTSRQLAAQERARYWRELRETIEKSRMETGQKRKPGRPRKAAP